MKYHNFINITILLILYFCDCCFITCFITSYVINRFIGVLNHSVGHTGHNIDPLQVSGCDGLLRLLETHLCGIVFDAEQLILL